MTQFDISVIIVRSVASNAEAFERCTDRDISLITRYVRCRRADKSASWLRGSQLLRQTCQFSFYCFSSTAPQALVLADGRVSAPLSPKQKHENSRHRRTKLWLISSRTGRPTLPHLRCQYFENFGPLLRPPAAARLAWQGRESSEALRIFSIAHLWIASWEESVLTFHE